MNILVAPDSFKESVTADEAARAIAAGLREVWRDAEIVCLPMADGGEGMTAAVISATGGRAVRMKATGPMGEAVDCAFGVTGDGQTAVVELAAASGLELVKAGERNPLVTSTFGTGEMIRSALGVRAKRLLIGVGGSATVDGGAGIVEALGARLLDERGRQIGRGGGALRDLRRIDVSGLDARIKDVQVEVACDVSNPLLGEEGAAAVFGPQKGATPEMVRELEEGLTRFAEVVEESTGVQVATMPGGGAAGGAAAALMAFLGARLRPGVEVVAEIVGLETAVRRADLVITGEGRLDAQSSRGKTPVGVAAMARRFGKPVIAFAGCVDADAKTLRMYGFDAAFCIHQRATSLEQALRDARENLQRTAHEVAALWSAGARFGC